MPRIVNDADALRAERAFGSPEREKTGGATVRPRRTGESCKRHRNDGVQACVAPGGTDDMNCRASGDEDIVRLQAGRAGGAGFRHAVQMFTMPAIGARR